MDEASEFISIKSTSSAEIEFFMEAVGLGSAPTATWKSKAPLETTPGLLLFAQLSDTTTGLVLSVGTTAGLVFPEAKTSFYSSPMLLSLPPLPPPLLLPSELLELCLSACRSW